MRPLAALALLLAALAAGCGAKATAVQPAVAASPQAYDLQWVERTPTSGPAMVFRVRSFTVTKTGWEADIAIENATGVNWELPERGAAYQRMFGVMVFDTGDPAELDRLNSSGDLPTTRAAQSYTPALTTFLADGATWSGRISAAGSLPREAWVRVVFGPLTSVGSPPKGLPKDLVWITDHAVQLR